MSMRKLVHGVGINDAEYATQRKIFAKGKMTAVWRCPFYRKWSLMLARCYSSKVQAKKPTYIGITVCIEWLRFSTFRAWMESQDWKGNELDKDLLIPGNKIYSPETCVFVSQELNKFTNSCGASRGDYPIGVSWHNVAKKFRARCCNPFTGKQETLGRFECKNSAHEAWRQRKRELACHYADMQTDPRIAEALRTRLA